MRTLYVSAEHFKLLHYRTIEDRLRHYRTRHYNTSQHKSLIVPTGKHTSLLNIALQRRGKQNDIIHNNIRAKVDAKACNEP